MGAILRQVTSGGSEIASVELEYSEYIQNGWINSKSKVSRTVLAPEAALASNGLGSFGNFQRLFL